MSVSFDFPPLVGWEATHKTLHLYGNVLGVVARVHAEPHPKWWHVSLKVHPEGLVTDRMALPQGDTFQLELNLRRHQIILSTSTGDEHRFDMTAAPTATEMGDQVLGAVGDLGLTGDYDRQRFDNEEPRTYDPAAVEKFLSALVRADAVLKRHRETLVGEVGPVQLWPHGFDLSFEWYGTRMETHEEDGKLQELPAQINFGFYPGEPTYFYANPWPFDADKLVDQPLPGGALWHEEGWQGTMLPYADVVGDPEAEERLLSYLGEVYKVASPTLLA
ncbi:MAG: DUF5996 family protein [Thermoanaerobaculia bacterium]